MMGDYHGDEDECNGHCGLCDECDDKYYASCDDYYDDNN